MSVPGLVSSLVRKVTFGPLEREIDEDSSAERAVAALAAKTRQRRKVDRIVRKLNWVPYESFLRLDRYPEDLDQRIREYVLAADLELRSTQSLATLVQRVVELNPEAGPAIAYILLTLRNTSARDDGIEGMKNEDWWNVERLRPNRPEYVEPQEESRVIIPGDQATLSVNSDEAERLLIEQALRSSWKSGNAIVTTGLDQTEVSVRVCETLLAQHRNPDSLLSSAFCGSIDTILAEIMDKVHVLRQSYISSLLLMEKKAFPVLRECHAVRALLNDLSAIALDADSRLSWYLDGLAKFIIPGTESSQAAKGRIAVRVHHEMLGLVTRVLTEFFSRPSADSKSEGSRRFPSDFVYENAQYEPGSCFPHGDNFKWILILPDCLGGRSLARRCSYIRELCSRFNNVVAVGFGRQLTPEAIKHACDDLEQRVLNVIRPRLARDLNHWHECLMGFQREEDDSDWDSDHRSKASLSPEINRVVSRCAAVLQSVEKTRKACMDRFEMYHLVRGLQGFFLENIHYLVFPRLLDAVNAAQGGDDVWDCLEQFRDDLVNLFFLKDDVRFLATDSLLEAVAKHNVTKFRKSRAFLVKCFGKSSSGRVFLDLIDPNGFYQRCANELT